MIFGHGCLLQVQKTTFIRDKINFFVHGIERHWGVNIKGICLVIQVLHHLADPVFLRFHIRCRFDVFPYLLIDWVVFYPSQAALLDEIPSQHHTGMGKNVLYAI